MPSPPTFRSVHQAEEAALQKEVGLLVRLTTSPTAAAERRAVAEQQLSAASESGGDPGVSEWSHTPFLPLQYPALKADPYLRMHAILSRLEVQGGDGELGGTVQGQNCANLCTDWMGELSSLIQVRVCMQARDARGVRGWRGWRIGLRCSGRP